MNFICDFYVIRNLKNFIFYVYWGLVTLYEVPTIERVNNKFDKILGDKRVYQIFSFQGSVINIIVLEVLKIGEIALGFHRHELTVNIN